MKRTSAGQQTASGFNDLLDYLDDLIRCACCDWNRVGREGQVCSECREDSR
jgi:hypothetical protein